MVTRDRPADATVQVDRREDIRWSVVAGASGVIDEVAASLEPRGHHATKHLVDMGKSVVEESTSVSLSSSREEGMLLCARNGTVVQRRRCMASETIDATSPRDVTSMRWRYDQPRRRSGGSSLPAIARWQAIEVTKLLIFLLHRLGK